MDSKMLTRAKASLNKTKSSISLANPKDPTKCEECKSDLPYHSRSCVSGKDKLCIVCGRDKTYNHTDAVCVTVAKNRANWSPDVEADAHAAALRKQGDLPPTPIIESQSSLKRSNSEEEHHVLQPPARMDVTEDMEADDLYVPNTSQAPQVDNDMDDISISEYEDPQVAERVSASFQHLTNETIQHITTLITQPSWTSPTPWHDDPIRAGKALADVASNLVSWVSKAHCFDDETIKENKANEGLQAFHSSYRIHSPEFKHVFDDVHVSAQAIREQHISDNMSTMSRSIQSLSSLVSSLVDKTDKLEKQLSRPSYPSSSVAKPPFSTNKPQVKFLPDPVGARFVHDNRFPPDPPIVKQRVITPKSGKSDYAGAIANTRVPGSGYRMSSDGVIYAPDGYAHSAHNAPRPGGTTIYHPKVESVGTDNDGFTTVTYAKAAQKKPKTTPTKVSRPTVENPDGEISTVPVNRSNGSVNIRSSNIKWVYFSLPGDLAVRPLTQSVKNAVRAGLKGNPLFKHLVVLNVEYTSNSNLLISFTNIRSDFDANYPSLATQLSHILNISRAKPFIPSPQFKMVIPGVPVYDRESKLIYSESDLFNEISALPQFEGRQFMFPPRFMSSPERLNERDYCNVSVIMKDPDRLSFDHFFLHGNRSVPVFGVIRRLEEMKACPTINQCDNCHRLGHPASKCRSVARCAICSETHRTAVHVAKCAPCTAANNLQCEHFALCINCHGNHSVRSSDCPARRNYRSPY